MTKEEQAAIFSANLSRIIKERGFTQVEIAERLGVSQQAVHTWVSGENVPRLNKAQRLAQLLGVKLTDLVYPHSSPETLVEAFNRRPDLRRLFEIAFDLTDEELSQAVKIVEALRA